MLPALTRQRSARFRQRRFVGCDLARLEFLLALGFGFGGQCRLGLGLFGGFGFLREVNFVCRLLLLGPLGFLLHALLLQRLSHRGVFLYGARRLRLLLL